MTATPAPRPKVLYVAGAHRSGTTLLTGILGGYAGVFAAGELHEVWQNLVTGRPCGCGLLLDRCPIWGTILEEVLENAFPKPVRPRDAMLWRARAARVWHTPLILRQANRPERASPAAKRWSALMEALYASIALRTGSRVIVDSTKIASGAALLMTMDHIEPYVVHLVRDPRATAYSWSKRKVRLVSGWEEKLVEAGSFSSGLQWLGYNLLAELVSRRRHGGWTRLRYEDFVENPRTEAQTLVSWLGLSSATGPFEGPDLAALHGGHMIAGNPDRFDAGITRVRRDDRWLAGMNKTDRWTVTAISLPLLHRYGYGLRAPRLSTR